MSLHLISYAPSVGPVQRACRLNERAKRAEHLGGLKGGTGRVFVLAGDEQCGLVIFQVCRAKVGTALLQFKRNVESLDTFSNRGVSKARHQGSAHSTLENRASSIYSSRVVYQERMHYS
jgi:hypothetical protein